MAELALRATNGLDLNEVCDYLREHFINDDENYKKFSPMLHTKVSEELEKELKAELERAGAKFTSDPILVQTEYKFGLITGYGEIFNSVTIVIDYWKANAYVVKN